MYLGSWQIDDLLTFSANTHNATTGVATDADAPPTYRVYENETAVPILTGTMALLDAVNTTGFYSEEITLSAANGFEAGKSYTIYITGAVAGISGTTARFFQILAQVSAGNATIFPQGAIEFTYTVTNSVTLNPIEGVDVWFTTDLAGNNTIWSGVTDAFGVARDINDEKPFLDPGTYYVWRQLAGFSFVNPDTETVSNP